MQRKFAYDDDAKQLSGEGKPVDATGNQDYISDLDHPLDLSFTKDMQYGDRRLGGSVGNASVRNLNEDSGEIDQDSISLSEDDSASIVIAAQSQQKNGGNNEAVNDEDSENPFDRDSR